MIVLAESVSPHDEQDSKLFISEEQTILSGCARRLAKKIGIMALSHIGM